MTPGLDPLPCFLTTLTTFTSRSWSPSRPTYCTHHLHVSELESVSPHTLHSPPSRLGAGVRLAPQTALTTFTSRSWSPSRPTHCTHHLHVSELESVSPHKLHSPPSRLGAGVRLAPYTALTTFTSRSWSPSRPTNCTHHLHVSELESVSPHILHSPPSRLGAGVRLAPYTALTTFTSRSWSPSRPTNCTHHLHVSELESVSPHTLHSPPSRFGAGVRLAPQTALTTFTSRSWSPSRPIHCTHHLHVSELESVSPHKLHSPPSRLGAGVRLAPHTALTTFTSRSWSPSRPIHCTHHLHVSELESVSPHKLHSPLSRLGAGVRLAPHTALTTFTSRSWSPSRPTNCTHHLHVSELESVSPHTLHSPPSRLGAGVRLAPQTALTTFTSRSWSPSRPIHCTHHLHVSELESVSPHKLHSPPSRLGAGVRLAPYTALTTFTFRSWSPSRPTYCTHHLHVSELESVSPHTLHSPPSRLGAGVRLAPQTALTTFTSRSWSPSRPIHCTHHLHISELESVSPHKLHSPPSRLGAGVRLAPYTALTTFTSRSWSPSRPTNCTHHLHVSELESVSPHTLHSPPLRLGAGVRLAPHTALTTFTSRSWSPSRPTYCTHHLHVSELESVSPHTLHSPPSRLGAGVRLAPQTALTTFTFRSWSPSRPIHCTHHLHVSELESVSPHKLHSPPSRLGAGVRLAPHTALTTFTSRSWSPSRPTNCTHHLHVSELESVSPHTLHSPPSRLGAGVRLAPQTALTTFTSRSWSPSRPTYCTHHLHVSELESVSPHILHSPPSRLGAGVRLAPYTALTTFTSRSWSPSRPTNCTHHLHVSELESVSPHTLHSPPSRLGAGVRLAPHTALTTFTSRSWSPSRPTYCTHHLHVSELESVSPHTLHSPPSRLGAGVRLAPQTALTTFTSRSWSPSRPIHCTHHLHVSELESVSPHKLHSPPSRLGAGVRLAPHTALTTFTSRSWSPSRPTYCTHHLHVSELESVSPHILHSPPSRLGAGVRLAPHTALTTFTSRSWSPSRPIHCTHHLHVSELESVSPHKLHSPPSRFGAGVRLAPYTALTTFTSRSWSPSRPTNCTHHLHVSELESVSPHTLHSPPSRLGAGVRLAPQTALTTFTSRSWSPSRPTHCTHHLHVSELESVSPHILHSPPSRLGAGVRLAPHTALTTFTSRSWSPSRPIHCTHHLHVSELESVSPHKLHSPPSRLGAGVRLAPHTALTTFTSRSWSPSRPTYCTHHLHVSELESVSPHILHSPPSRLGAGVRLAPYTALTTFTSRSWSPSRPTNCTHHLHVSELESVSPHTLHSPPSRLGAGVRLAPQTALTTFTSRSWSPSRPTYCTHHLHVSELESVSPHILHSPPSRLGAGVRLAPYTALTTFTSRSWSPSRPTNCTHHLHVSELESVSPHKLHSPPSRLGAGVRLAPHTALTTFTSRSWSPSRPTHCTLFTVTFSSLSSFSSNLRFFTTNVAD
ncbi:uro-adherence factor A-like [Haliotis cracherodii]|uniref:uro-adherence factor A-like n=1 Tax=Haliotis cracherodii TaxID=6455 RepID=UPI0039EA09EA